MIRPWIDTRERVRRSTWPIMSGLLVVSVAAACEQRMIRMVAAGGNVTPAKVTDAFDAPAGGEPGVVRLALEMPSVSVAEVVPHSPLV